MTSAHAWKYVSPYIDDEKSMHFFARSFRIILENDALQKTIRGKRHRFSAIFRDPEHFSLKIVDFSASGTNRLLDVVGSVPELKIIGFLQSVT